MRKLTSPPSPMAMSVAHSPVQGCRHLGTWIGAWPGCWQTLPRVARSSGETGRPVRPQDASSPHGTPPFWHLQSTPGAWNRKRIRLLEQRFLMGPELRHQLRNTENKKISLHPDFSEREKVKTKR